jgi:hypothetical protein
MPTPIHMTGLLRIGDETFPIEMQAIPEPQLDYLYADFDSLFGWNLPAYVPAPKYRFEGKACLTFAPDLGQTYWADFPGFSIRVYIKRWYADVMVRGYFVEVEGIDDTVIRIELPVEPPREEVSIVELYALAGGDGAANAKPVRFDAEGGFSAN